MNYFKMIRDNKIIDVGTTFIRLDKNHNILFVSDPDHAQFIESYDCKKIYHDTWLKSIRNTNINCEFANIVEIDKDEYDELVALLDDKETINVEDNNNEEIQIVEDTVEKDEQMEKPMSISEMRDRIKELTELVDKLTSVITALNNSNVG